MNYLQLCQHVRQECGIQGEGPSTVIGQKGLLKKVVERVRDADLFIQSLHGDWDFLWNEFTDDTSQGSDEITKPTGFGMWDRESFAVDRGTADGRPLKLMDFKKWRQNHNLKTAQPPYVLTILPNNNLRLSQPADGIYTIYATYWTESTVLVADTDLPQFTSRYHRMIVAKAKMYFFADQESSAQYQEAEKEYKEWLELLEAFALPGQQFRNQGQPELMAVRPA